VTWSPQQVEAEIEQLFNTIEESVAQLRKFTNRAARLKAMHDLEMAKAMTEAKVVLKTEENKKPTVDDCKSFALEALSEIMVPWRDGDEGTSYELDLHTAHELSELAHATERDILRARQEEAGMLRTLLVQARQVQDSGR
jgi:crotonobetainyl-CoA:carnitine CoA-transferase CaiB-like acyl-CoA transferase